MDGAAESKAHLVALTWVRKILKITKKKEKRKRRTSQPRKKLKERERAKQCVKKGFFFCHPVLII